MFLCYKNLLSNTPTEVFSAVWQGLSRPLIHDQAKGVCPLPEPIPRQPFRLLDMRPRSFPWMKPKSLRAALET